MNENNNFKKLHIFNYKRPTSVSLTDTFFRQLIHE